MMPSAHSAWSLGASVIPFIVQPFLIERPDVEENITNISDQKLLPTYNDHSNTNLNGSYNNTKPVFKVAYAYLCTGSGVILVSLLVVVACCLGPTYCKTCILHNCVNKTTGHSEQNLSLFFVIGSLVVLWFGFWLRFG